MATFWMFVARLGMRHAERRGCLGLTALGHLAHIAIGFASIKEGRVDRVRGGPQISDSRLRWSGPWLERALRGANDAGFPADLKAKLAVEV